MAIKVPVLPAGLPAALLAEAARAAIEEGDTISDRLFEDDCLEALEADALDFSRCLFRRVRFEPCELERIHFLDCRFEKCELSGFPLREGTLRRVVFEDCRASGATFSRMSLRDARFARCQLGYASFVESRFQEVAFSECQMEHALLHGCTQKALALEDCMLRQAEVIETPLSGVDLSGCDIDGLRSSVRWLEGTTVSLLQAPAVLGLCGIALKA